MAPKPFKLLAVSFGQATPGIYFVYNQFELAGTDIGIYKSNLTIITSIYSVHFQNSYLFLTLPISVRITFLTGLSADESVFLKSPC